MNRTVDRAKFFRYLHSHPAMVKKLINPLEDTFVECIKTNYRCMEFIPKNKQTEKIITAYLKSNIRGYDTHTYLTENKEIAAKLSIDIVKQFLSVNPNNIVFFPQTPKELWIETAKSGNLRVEFAGIPEKIICEELLGALIRGQSNNHEFIGQIPESLWTDSLLTMALDKDNSYINHIPKSLVTKKWFMYALGMNAVMDLEIPEGLWDKELAELAADRTSLVKIPPHLRSKEVCLKSVLGSTYDVDAISRELWKDKDIQMAFIGRTSEYTSLEKYVPINKTEFQINTVKFFLKLMDEAPDTHKEKAHKEVKDVVETMKKFIRDWVPILKLCPEAITFIPKPDQTPEQILTALQSRTEWDNMELIARSLNLAKVTREMAPMLLNIENTIVKDFVERKLAPPKRSDGANSNEMLVDITPEEFRNINHH